MRSLAVLLLALAARAGDDVAVPPAEARLIADHVTVSAGGKVRVGVHFTIAPAWHLYWKNPGDSGMPPAIRWKLPAGVSVGALEWPVPALHESFGLSSYVYEGAVLLGAELTLAPDFAGPLQIEADVEWLVCSEICLDGSAKLAIELAVGAEKQLSPECKRFEARKFPQPKRDAKAHTDGKTVVLEVEGARYFFSEEEGAFVAAQKLIEGKGLVLTARDLPPRRLRGVLLAGDGAAWSLDIDLSSNDNKSGAASPREEPK